MFNLPSFHPLKEHKSRNRGSFEDMVEDFFNDLKYPIARSMAQRGYEFLPSIDLYDNDKEYILDIEMPGINKDDIEIKIDGNKLNIKGTKKQEREDKEQDYYRREIYYGTFQRSITLPESAEAKEIDAKLNEGILKIKIPKKGDKKAQLVKLK